MPINPQISLNVLSLKDQTFYYNQFQFIQKTINY